MSLFDSAEKEWVLRQLISHPCPACGYVRKLCEWPGCFGDTEYEGWFGSGLMRRMKVCKNHARESRAYKEHGEKIFDEAFLKFEADKQRQET